MRLLLRNAVIILIIVNFSSAMTVSAKQILHCTQPVFFAAKQILHCTKPVFFAESTSAVYTFRSHVVSMNDPINTSLFPS